MRSIQAEVGPSQNGSREQMERLGELRRKLASLPVAAVTDGLSNRDHDQILYGESR